MFAVTSTSSQGSRYHDGASHNTSTLQLLQGDEIYLCRKVRGSTGCRSANAADTSDEESDSSECSDSSDCSDVIVLDHKPADWIDSKQAMSRKRQREDEDDDDVVALDEKPADWIDRSLELRKRRRKAISTTAVPVSTGFGYSLHQEPLSAAGRTVIQQRMSKTEWVHYNFLMLMELAYHSDGKDGKELAMDFRTPWKWYDMIETLEE
ncbi:hypothetical protein EDD22DRAFT_853775 [Suillus occidentalis]|nr:hypothetical protein EDD22DRAFT_853775 [Suillus occidentalis]